MTDTKCGGLILDAIDQLRKRKARPDLDRICHMLERRHGLKGSVVNEELAKLVSSGSVIKVDYKGNTSYRNAAKWVKTKTQFNGFYATTDVTSSVLDAVRILTIPTKEHPQLRSASIQEIEQCLQKKDIPFNLTFNTLRTVLEKEVGRGNLHQLPSGEFVRLKCNAQDFVDSKYSDCIRKCDSTSPPKNSKGFDTSSHGSSNSPADESQINRCDYCLFTAAANRKGEAEELLICKDCGSKAHPSCMEYTKLLYESFPQPQNWQCPDCKTCVVCDETASRTEDLLTCFICLKGYHINCHDPALPSKPSGVWICADCDTSSDNSKDRSKYSKKIKVEQSGDDSDSSLSIPKDEFFKSIEKYPESIPLAKKWSIENVESFLKFLGFADEAPAFREQEIDGMSLLLMKRSDVLTGLGIKLGPALKIYKHIVKLQSRVTDN